MVIGLFDDVFPPFKDGVAQVVLNYAKGLINLGHKVYVVTGDYGATKEQYDEKHSYDFVYRLKTFTPFFTKPYGIIKVKRKDFRHLLEIPFDIIHINCPFYTGRLGRRIAEKKNIPLVGTLHSQYYKDILSSAFNWKFLSKMILKTVLKEFKKCDKLFAVNSATLALYREEPYSLKNDISVLNNAIDLKPFSESEKEHYEALVSEKYNINKDVPILLFVGQQNDKKNIPLLLEALKLLALENVNFRAFFIGSGAHLDKYLHFVDSNNLKDKITFVGAIDDRKVLSAFYSLSYMFLFPSYYDTSGLVSQESACFKTPTLFARGSAASEGVGDLYNGYLADNDAESVKNTIKRALENREENEKIGQKAFETLYKTWDDQIKVLEAEYKTVIENFGKK